MPVEHEIRFTLNGRPAAARIPVQLSTLELLRERFQLTGTKLGCGEGECGACTILVDGVAVNACLMFAVQCDGREVVTIEGLLDSGGLSRLQESFVRHGAIQCGFCTPGMVMQATALLRRHAAAGAPLDAAAIARGIEGNLCRCTGYQKVIEAIAAAVVPEGSQP